MKRILVPYATMSSSTAEVAQAVGEGIAGEGAEVDVVSLEKVTDLAAYHAVAIGAPMIMGWHRPAIRFLKKYRKALEPTPPALVATAMSLTSTGELAVEDVPVWVDQALAKPPRNPQHPTLRKNYASITPYASPC
jgi:menaquinone-dependent protoporphyrinogen IX oxidase